MKLKCTLLFSICLMMIASLKAQDRHFTLYNFSPIILNPAQTGSFNGTLRIGGIHRSQGLNTNDIANNFDYNSQSFYADAPIITVRKRDWVSAGLDFYQDKAGSLDYGDTWFKLAGAYHLSLDKKQKSILSLGVKWGTVTRSFNPGNSVSQDNMLDPGLLSQGETRTRFQDYGAGLLLKNSTNDDLKFELGIAADHVTTPGDNRKDRQRRNTTQPNPNPNPNNAAGDGVNFIGQDSLGNVRLVSLPFNWTGHGKFDIQINKEFSIAPSFLIQTTRGTRPEVVLQAPVGFTFNQERNQKLIFGLGYRLGDALQFLAGYEVKDVRFALSYDLTTSSKRQISSGGFEIAASYIIKVYKQPKIEPAILCPNF